MIEINENYIISCGIDTKMKIWKKNKKDMNFLCIDTLTVNEKYGSSTNILKINENEIVSAATQANYIIFWEPNTPKAIKKIDNIVCHWNRNSMKMINKTTLFIGGDEYYGIYLINIENYQVFSFLANNNIVSISAIIKLSNGNILIGCQQESISDEENIMHSYSLIEYKYNYNGKSLTKVKSNNKTHENIITGLLAMNNGEIISCSLDMEIKFWI